MAINVKFFQSQITARGGTNVTKIFSQIEYLTLELQQDVR
jgi:hypothetical protein